MKMRRNWQLGFLGFMTAQGIPGFLSGDYLQAIWLVWVVWFIYFLPTNK
ncbi:hypothetical protein KKA33_02785 [Patescibacteria group bacterium]|nr:hypothetical protein [Patescibacteria group bacterium]